MLQLPLSLLRSSSQILLCSLSSSVVRGPVFLRWFGLLVLRRNLAIQAETHSTGHSLNLLRILAKAFTFSSDASLNTSFMDFIQRLRSWSCSNICRPSICIRKPYRPVSLKAVFLVYMTSTTSWVSWFSFFFYFHLIHSFFRILCTRLLMNCFYSPFLQSNGERQWKLKAYLSSALIRTCRKAFLMSPVAATGLKHPRMSTLQSLFWFRGPEFRHSFKGGSVWYFQLIHV